MILNVFMVLLKQRMYLPLMMVLPTSRPPFISAVRPLLCALQSLEIVGGVDDDGEEIQGPDPDISKHL